MTQNFSPPLPTVLTIAGSDCSAGAGLQADLKTVHACGGYALTVATAITAQNSQGVSAVYPLPTQIVQSQLQAIVDDYDIQAIKIGMLGNTEILKTVIAFLQQINHPNVVLDPVLISSSGKPLLEHRALPILIHELLPQTRLITPNIPEVNALLNREGNLIFEGKKEEMPEVAQALLPLNINAAVIKGGHSTEPLATDYLIQHDDGQQERFNIQSYSTQRIKTDHTHGTGCTYASAIATELAKGNPLTEAVKQAKQYLFKAIMQANVAQPNYQNTTHNRNLNRKGGLNHLNMINQGSE